MMVRRTDGQTAFQLYIDFFLNRSNLLKAFQVNLKACLGTVLPNQYCLIVIRENEAGFWVMFFHGLRLLLCGPYIQYYRTV